MLLTGRGGIGRGGGGGGRGGGQPFVHVTRGDLLPSGGLGLGDYAGFPGVAGGEAGPVAGGVVATIGGGASRGFGGGYLGG